jgi:hypothetical protein
VIEFGLRRESHGEVRARLRKRDAGRQPRDSAAIAEVQVEASVAPADNLPAIATIPFSPTVAFC